MPYWAVARLQPRHERYGLYCLQSSGFTPYYPQLREYRRSHGRRVELHPPLFPGYCFIVIELQWSAARWAAGVLGLIMDGVQPARVSDAIVDRIRAQEVRGFIELPKPRGLHHSTPVRILGGPFTGHLAIFAGMRPRDRVEVLLRLLGGEHKVLLPKAGIMAL